VIGNFLKLYTTAWGEGRTEGASLRRPVNRWDASVTPWDLIRSMIRRWPILVAGAVCTAVLGYFAIGDDGVYYTRTDVVFLAPSSALYPNSLRTTSEDLIITAGVVSKAVTGPGRVTKYAAPDVTLIGIGVRDGWSIRLPDTGGQWASNFASQLLVVEAVAADPAAAKETLQELIDRIADELNSLQRDANVDPVNDITLSVLPEPATIYHVGGSKIRAVVMVGLLGAGATAALVVLLDYRRRRLSERV